MPYNCSFYYFRSPSKVKFGVRPVHQMDLLYGSNVTPFLCFYARNGTSSIDGLFRFQSTRYLASPVATFTSGSTRLSNIDFGPSLCPGHPLRDILPRKKLGNPETHDGTRIPGYEHFMKRKVCTGTIALLLSTPNVCPFCEHQADDLSAISEFFSICISSAYGNHAQRFPLLRPRYQAIHPAQLLIQAGQYLNSSKLLT